MIAAMITGVVVGLMVPNLAMPVMPKSPKCLIQVGMPAKATGMANDNVIVAEQDTAVTQTGCSDKCGSMKKTFDKKQWGCLRQKCRRCNQACKGVEVKKGTEKAKCDRLDKYCTNDHVRPNYDPEDKGVSPEIVKRDGDQECVAWAGGVLATKRLVGTRSHDCCADNRHWKDCTGGNCLSMCAQACANNEECRWGVYERKRSWFAPTCTLYRACTKFNRDTSGYTHFQKVGRWSKLSAEEGLVQHHALATKRAAEKDEDKEEHEEDETAEATQEEQKGTAVDHDDENSKDE